MLLSSSECSVLINTTIETRKRHAPLSPDLGTPPFSMCTCTHGTNIGMWVRLMISFGADEHRVLVRGKWRKQKSQTFPCKKSTKVKTTTNGNSRIPPPNNLKHRRSGGVLFKETTPKRRRLQPTQRANKEDSQKITKMVYKLLQASKSYGLTTMNNEGIK